MAQPAIYVTYDSRGIENGLGANPAGRYVVPSGPREFDPTRIHVRDVDIGYPVGS